MFNNLCNYENTQKKMKWIFFLTNSGFISLSKFCVGQNKLVFFWKVF